MILREATIRYANVDPNTLSKGSHVRVCCSCNECGRVKWLPYQAYRVLCKSCSNKQKQLLPKPKFVKEKDRFIDGSQVDRILTIEKFDYDPADLSRGSGKKVIVKCKKCGKSREIIFNQYRNICGSCSHKGKLNPCWKGGISNEPYCLKFNESLRIKIRNKYNNCDYISGIHKDICSPDCNLSVHHINYDKQCGCNDNKCKLIPLSHSNHMRTNSNRIFWNRLFIYALEIDKWYYSDNKVNLNKQ